MWGASIAPLPLRQSAMASGSVMAGGATVGDGAVIGAAAVVFGHVPPFAVVAGNPARILRYRFEQPVIDRLLRIAWWDWPFDKVVGNAGGSMVRSRSAWRHSTRTSRPSARKATRRPGVWLVLVR